MSNILITLTNILIKQNDATNG